MEVAKAKPCNDTAAAAARTSHVSQKLTRDDSKEIARLAKKMKILSNSDMSRQTVLAVSRQL